MTQQSVTRDRGFDLRYGLARLFFMGLMAIQLSHGEARANDIPPLSDRRTPVNVIFDTDMWSDIDDAFALAMLHALQDRHEVNLLAVTVSTQEKWCASYVDLLDTFYGYPSVPVGIVYHGMNVESFRKKFPDHFWPPIRYTEVLSQRKNLDGTLVYPHRLIDGMKAPEAATLLRKTLADQPDASVVIIQVGYSTNLAHLLDSGPDGASSLAGRDLVKRKVRLLSVMAGNFGGSSYEGKAIAKGAPEFNLFVDVPSAQKVFSRWPTPIVASGFEIGLTLLYPATSIERDYTYVANHPLAEAYRSFVEDQKATVKWPHDHPTFDLTSVLYAARPDRDYFSVSKPGTITVLDDGSSRFEESEQGAHRYLILNDAQKARTLEALVMLSSQPPVKSPSMREP